DAQMHRTLTHFVRNRLGRRSFFAKLWSAHASSRRFRFWIATMRCNEIKIRSATTKDHDAIWKIFHEIISAGDTYSLDPRMSREEALAYWFRADTQTYVAELHRQSVGEAVGFPGTATPSPTGGMKDQVIVGTYILRPSQSGGGSHVANAAFMVASDAQGCCVGRAMAEQ